MYSAFKATIYRIEAKFHETESVLDKKKTRRRHLLTEERPDNVGTRLEANRKSHCVSWIFSVFFKEVYSALQQNCSVVTTLRNDSCAVFCLRNLKREFDTVGGFTNLCVMVFLTQYLVLI
jgi:hypothetical protein